MPRENEMGRECTEGIVWKTRRPGAGGVGEALQNMLCAVILCSDLNTMVCIR